MKTMKWLLRREFWEHKGSMLWAPIVVAAILLVTMGGSLIYGFAVKGFSLTPTVTVNGHQVARSELFSAMPHEMRSDFINVITSGYLATSVPLFILLTVVVFFYCLGALYDERRDRSILFWKSLPASDEQTVLSKVITAAFVTPVITIAAATALSLVLLLLACVGLALNGINVFGAVLASPQLYLSPLALLSLLPVYALWALPTIGWLLLVSSWARSKVFLWAVGTPLIALVIAKWLSFMMTEGFGIGFDIKWLAQDVVARGLTGLVPGIWLTFQDISPAALAQQGHKGLSLAAVVAESWKTLGTVDLWAGVAAGAAMIFGAMRLRRFRDEG